VDQSYFDGLERVKMAEADQQFLDELIKAEAGKVGETIANYAGSDMYKLAWALMSLAYLRKNEPRENVIKDISGRLGPTQRGELREMMDWGG